MDKTKVLLKLNALQSKVQSLQSKLCEMEILIQSIEMDLLEVNESDVDESFWDLINKIRKAIKDK